MSLLRYPALFDSSEFYSMDDGNDCSGVSTSMFDSDNQMMIYPSEPCSSDCNDFSKSFLVSPSEEFISAKNQFSSGCDYVYQFGYESGYLDWRSSDVVGHDEKMRLKLQEIEKVLLDDNVDSVYDAETLSMEIDNFSVPIGHTLLHHSQKDSSSSDSMNNMISSSKKVSKFTLQTPKHLLFECAAALNRGNIEEASYKISVLREMVSIQGDPSDRIAAYMVEALAARMAKSGRGLYKALKCKEPPSLDRLSAMQVLFEACPCFRFSFMAANGAIIEALVDEKEVHILDFDVNQGSQYYSLLEMMAKTPGKHPHLRLTGVDDLESVNRSVGGLKNIGQRLEQLAKDLKISFEFQSVATESALVSPSILNCQPGEALIVNFAFQLHHMPDESVSTVNLRDQLLRMVKGLKPKLVTVVEQDMNTNTTPFLPRFAEAYSYYHAVFESLDAALAKDSQERMNVEKHCLARDIINVVACEGEERIERYEVAGKWKARLIMAGFIACPFSRKVNSEIQKLVKNYSDRYKIKEEIGALHFGWEDKRLVFSSAWR